MTSGELLRAIDRFMFAPYSPYPVALFRILIGLLMLDSVVLHSVDDFYLFYGPNAILPIESVSRNWWRFDPVIDLMILLPPHVSFTVGFFVLFCILSLCVSFGLLTAYTVPASFIMLLSIHRQFPYNLNGGDSMMSLSLFLLCFARSGDALSIDNLLRSLRQDWRAAGFAPPLTPAWPLRMLQLQLTLAYLDTFLWKFTGTKWLDGTAVYWATRMPDFIRFPLPPFVDNIFCMRFFTWSTLVVEFALATLIWFRETRYTVIVAGFALHLGIDCFINLPVFEWVFIAMLVLFIYPEDLSRCAAFVRGTVKNWLGPTRILSFDGHCLLCVRSTGVLHRLDVFRHIEFIDFTDERNHEKLKNFDFARAQTEMLLSTDSGWVGGFRAFQKMAAWMPLFWPFLPVLITPGIELIGDAVYRLIAKNRYLLLGRCANGVCEVHSGAKAKESEPQ